MSETGWGIVYHYTSLSTFVNIVKSGELRLSDITKSNDPIECTFALDAIKKAYHQIINREDITEQQRRFMHCCCFEYIESIYCYGHLNNLVLAVSFCEPEHELSLWRTYGDNGCGIAIGFSKNKLAEFAQVNDGFCFDKIEYLSPQELEKRAIDVWEKVLQSSPCDCDEMPESAKKLLDDFFFAGYFVKHNSNSDENEYRLLWHSVNFSDFILPLISKKLDNLDFIATSNGLRAYLPIKLVSPTESTTTTNRYNASLNNIVLGPNCNTSITEMQLFLLQHNLSCFSVQQTTNIHITR